jgi:uncharacterized membrane protein YGL010W
MGGRSWDEWIAEYSRSHQNPLNRLFHTVGIPMIAVSVVLFVLAIIWHSLWPVALSLFIIGWIFQFAGHFIEGKPPEFFHDWRFLFVGLRWWLAKIAGRA